MFCLQYRSISTTAHKGTLVLTPDVYLRWADIDTKVLGTLLLIVIYLTQQNERHLVIKIKSSPGNRVIIQVARCKVSLPNVFHFVE